MPLLSNDQPKQLHTVGKWFWLRVLITILSVVLFSVLTRHLQLDDALIYDRYVANALHGLGLVYNAGEPVNALTSPLYAYLLLGVSWLLHGEVQLAAVLVFCCAFSATCVLAEYLFPCSGVLLSGVAYFYGLIGMESALLLLLLILSITLYVKGQIAWLPTVLALLVLTRTEAGALAAAIFWRLYRDKNLPRPVTFLPAVMLAAVVMWINFHLYGSILPASSSAKFGQGLSGYWGVWPTAFLRIWHIWPYFSWTPYVLIGIALFSWNGIVRMKHSSWNRIVVPFLSILFGFYWLFNLPAYHWYYAPFIFLLCIYAVAAVMSLRVGPTVVLAVVILQAVTNIFWLPRIASGEHEYAKAGNWIAVSTAPNARIAACEIGEIGWVSKRNIIDILGLTTPKNAVYISHRDPSKWLDEDRPDYIVVHKPAWVFEAAAVRSHDYEDTAFRSDSLRILRRVTP